MKRLMIVLALALFVIPSSAFAVAILDFGTGTAGSGGLLTISGLNASGSGIFIDTLTVNGTLGHDGVYNVDGAGISATATNGITGILSFDTASGNNFIKITGTVPGLQNSSVDLLTGTISNFTITNSGFTGSISATGPDSKDPVLLRALGILPSTPFNVFGFSLGFNLNGGGSPYTVTSTDILNTEVPEPSALLLIGSGMAILGALRLRKRS